MGRLALAAKITHVPSMYLSEIDGPRKGRRQDAIDGHIEIGRRCRELGVDTIVVFDTHWLVNANYHINCAPHFKGTYTSNELPHFISNMAFECPGNPALGKILAAACNEFGVETLAHDATTLDPEYGTLVPMRYMNADRHFKVVSVSAMCTVHYLNDSARLGWAIRRAVEDHYDGTVAFLASGSLSHRFAQNGLAPEYRVQDLEPLPRAPRPRRGRHVAARRVEGLLRDAARVRHQGPRRRLHARHRDAARRARLGPIPTRRRKSSRPTSEARAPARSTPCSRSRRRPAAIRRRRAGAAGAATARL